MARLRRLWPRVKSPDVEIPEWVSPRPREDADDTKTRDYGDSANALWSLYGKDAENHDKALIETWRSDMESIIIFAGLYSATLTSFLVDSYKNLQSDPAQETVFYGRQSAVSLAQISQQLASNGTQPPINPASFVPLPGFTPSSSDVRVNIYWFMSLVFSLSAALFATIIQQWARYYTHLFQRYDHALKRARLRQYLFEGATRSRMSVMVEVVPALIHISLFLFFMGLADFLFHLNTTAAIATVIPMALCASFYIWAVIGPVILPQSSYQTPFSGLFWYLFQKIGGHKHHDRGSLQPVSTNMAEGRMQLAMDETDERQVRDARAIAWLISNRTEESEIEQLVLSIPASFNSVWGIATWRTVARRGASDEDKALALPIPHPDAPFPSGPIGSFFPGGRWRDLLTQPLPEIHPHSTVRGLCKNVKRSLETCTNLISSGEKLACARACIESIAFLAIHTGVSMDEFGDPFTLQKMLIDVGVANESALKMLPNVTGSTIPFEMHLMCTALLTFGALPGDPIPSSFIYPLALEQCRAVDRLLHSGFQCVKGLCDALEGGPPNDDEERTQLHWVVSDICSLFPGALLNTSTEPSPLIQALATSFRDEHSIVRQLVPAGPILQTLVAFGPRLRRIIEDTDAVSGERAVDLANELQGIWGELRANGSPMNVTWKRMEERRYWRTKDCEANGGFGFLVELFFIALQRLLLDKPPILPYSHYVFYILTFRALTSAQRRRICSDATRRVLVDLLCDTLIPGRGIVSGWTPSWAISELLALLKDILQGQHSPYIDGAVRELEMAGGTGSPSCLYWRDRALSLFREVGTSAVGTVEVARTLADV
ncbi:hypothetical protein BC834DRAFT_968872 [Gloeopeniophorella convolvens]|nr:hypothetical protein BC834DRAFT_968872 [Gloeopeniophorella convolvens]